MPTFDKILMIGCGAIGKATLIYWEVIIPHITYHQLDIIEPTELPFELKDKMAHHRLEITKDNYIEILDNFAPNFIIDLSINVDSLSIINYAHTKNIPYISTALEDWKTFPEWEKNRDMYRHSLLMRQRVALMNNERPSPHHPTILVDHGMNPGLISHFAKVAIVKMAEMEGLEYSSIAEAASKLEICVIQCSEVDTQTTTVKTDPEIFRNTWSALGFIEEALDPVQIGWGSHEKEFDEDAGVVIDDEQRFIPVRGMDLKIRGFNPLVGKYAGYCIPHSESASLSRYLTYGKYRPSSYYVYYPSRPAIESINCLRKREYEPQEKYEVLTTSQIIGGHDAVGALLIRSDGRCYWSGTVIGKEDVFPEFLPYTNPTCLQVVCGVLTGIDYVASHPNQGVIFPEDVDSKRVFELCSQHLGRIVMEYMEAEMPTNFKDLMVK